MKIRVYILCYDDHSERIATEQFDGFVWATVLKIPSSVYLENCMYGFLLEQLLKQESIPWDTYDYVGTLSWKAPSKIAIPDMDAVSRYLRVSDHDVVAFCFNASTLSLVTQASMTHRAFRSIWCELLDQLGMDAEDVDTKVRPFYCNYWIAKPSWLKKYILFYMQAQLVLETHEPLQAALWSDSEYALSSLSSERCLKVFSRPYYPHHPFVCERLPSVFFTTQGARILYYTKPNEGVLRCMNGGKITIG